MIASGGTVHPLAELLGTSLLTPGNTTGLLNLAERSAELRATHEAAAALAGVRRHDPYVAHQTCRSTLPPVVRCGVRPLMQPPMRELFSAELISRCVTPRCRSLHHWLAASTTASSREHDARDEAARQAACYVKGAAPRRAALLLRGRAADGATVADVFRGYATTIVCPLRRAGFRVDTFVAAYARLRSEATDVLHPTRVALLPTRNSSNLLSTLASVVALAQYCVSQNVSYDFVVLTRMDLRLKQPLTRLPGMLDDGAHRRFQFVFRGARSNWREWGSSSICHMWSTTKRVADTLHTFDGAMLPYAALHCAGAGSGGRGRGCEGVRGVRRKPMQHTTARAGVGASCAPSSTI